MFTWNAEIFLFQFCCKKDSLQLLTFLFCTSSSWIEFINKTNVSISCLSLLHVHIQNICELKQVSVWLLSAYRFTYMVCIRWTSNTICKSTIGVSECKCVYDGKIPFIFHAIEMTLEKSISNWCKIPTTCHTILIV